MNDAENTSLRLGLLTVIFSWMFVVVGVAGRGGLMYGVWLATVGAIIGGILVGRGMAGEVQQFDRLGWRLLAGTIGGVLGLLGALATSATVTSVEGAFGYAPQVYLWGLGCLFVLVVVTEAVAFVHHSIDVELWKYDFW